MGTDTLGAILSGVAALVAALVAAYRQVRKVRRRAAKARHPSILPQERPPGS